MLARSQHPENGFFQAEASIGNVAHIVIDSGTDNPVDDAKYGSRCKWKSIAPSKLHISGDV